MRLNKALAAAGLCSRRKADELIADGLVCVNGKLVTEMGLQVDPEQDAITVNGTPLTQPDNASYTYLLLHKPIQVVSTAYDPEGRPTVLDILPASFKAKRLYPVGRLDYFSEGLLLLTDDGDLTHRLTHPRYHLPKCYEVHLREIPTKGMMQAMRKGMTLSEGEKLAPVEASLSEADPHILFLTLHQGINRQIRRMCRDLHLTILSLRRTSVGGIQLGALPPGECRPLSPEEVALLKG